MRFAGRISDWDDERGFGFVTPNGGGDRAFVHINEFQRGSRRPVTGDLISYSAGKDARGRLQARQIRHAGQKNDVRRQPWRLPRAVIGICVLLLACGAAALGRIPLPLAGVYVALSIVSWLMYGSDKSAAGREARRTPEAHLHVIDLLGGWPGALIAQQMFRHKTIKPSFQFAFWTTVALNVGAVAWLMASGKAMEIARMLEV